MRSLRSVYRQRRNFQGVSPGVPKCLELEKKSGKEVISLAGGDQGRVIQKLREKIFQERRCDHLCQMRPKVNVGWGLTIGLSTLELLTPQKDLFR